MDHNNNVGPIYFRVIRTDNPQSQKLIKEQQNPALTHNPYRLRKGLIKKVKKSVCIDSSYYLG